VKELVLKSNKIIKSEALIRGRYRLRPLALKLITTLISMVQKEDNPMEQEYCITVNDFTNLLEVKGEAYYKRLKEACYEIMSKPLYIQKQDSKDFEMYNWVSSIKYISTEALIKFKISSDLFPYIIKLKERYLKYNLKNILKLRGEYSVRLYEWLKDEFNKNARYGRSCEIVLTIEYIRKRLEIPDDSYDFTDIRRQILDKAQKDFLQHTDIKFNWEVASKRKKAIHSIKFKIYKNDKNIEIDEKLPTYLDTFLNFVNWLRERYFNTQKHFFFSKFQFDETEKFEIHFFGIDRKNLVYATHHNGGYGKNLSKSKAQTILNASYLCALHSEIYREMLINKEDFFEMYENAEYIDLFNLATKEIVEVLKKHNPREMPLM